MTISTGKYYPQLDGLRAIGVLGVLFYHTYDIRPLKENSVTAVYDLVVKLRDLPIYLFFILSGYLIMRILLSLREQPQRYARFYLPRLLRILPLYYFVIALLYLLLPGLLGRESIPFSEQVFYWLPMANSAMALHHPVTGPEHFWTLCIEIQFYLIIPLLVFKLSNRQLIGLFAAGLLISFIAKVFFIHRQLNPYYSTLCRMDIVILGCLAAVFPWPENKRHYLAGSALFLTGLLLTYVFIFRNGGMDWAYRLTLLAFGCLVLLLLTLWHPGRPGKLLGTGIFRRIAEAGYSTYAFHPFCIFGYYHFFGQHHYLADLGACMLLSLAAGHTGYRLIEHPLQKVRHQLQIRYLQSR